MPGISHPSAPPSHPLLMVGSLALLPSRPQKPHPPPPCLFQRKGREGAGASEGCLRRAHPPPRMQLVGLLEEAGRHRLGRRTQRAASQASQEMKLLRATMREPLF